MELSQGIAVTVDSEGAPASADVRIHGLQAQVVGVGTANSGHQYSQRALLDLFRVEDRRIRSVFLNGSIEQRYLTLPKFADDGAAITESQGELLAKHRRVGIDMGLRALRACLDETGAKLEDIRYLCCVTTTGMLTPGLSAHVCRELDLGRHCARLDVVGMGCNAGLNGLTAVNNWARANPGQLAVLLCVEVCSAAYIFDDSIETAVVNSLFGDGAAALAVVAGPPPAWSGPTLLKFSSRIIPEYIDAMRFDWNDGHGKFNFCLDRDVPYVIGSHAEQVIDALLKGTGLRRKDIAHWIVHSGGKKVIDAIRLNLGLSPHDLRHTTDVLANYGNLSSGSFLFSYQRLLAEDVAVPGDFAVMMTMGPGTTIELALMQW